MDDADKRNKDSERVLEAQDQAWHMDALDKWNVVLIVGLGLALIATIFVVILSKRKVLETDQRISQARAQASAAELKTEEIRKLNLDLQLVVERERTERIKLEKQVQDTASVAKTASAQAAQVDADTQSRKLTVQQKAAMLSELKKAVGSTLFIRATNSTPESESFANAIRQVFVEAGWKGDPVFLNMVVGTPTPPGLTVVGHGPDDVAAIAVQKALQGAGIDASYGINPDGVGSKQVVIVVGQKPPR